MHPSITEPKQVIQGTCPSKSNSYRIVTIGKKGEGHSSLAKTKALIDYEKHFYLQCNLYRNKNISGLFEFHMDVYYPSNRSDLDNSCKVVLDCLQKVGAIKNDNNCVAIHLNKYKDAANPRVEFVLKAV